MTIRTRRSVLSNSMAVLAAMVFGARRSFASGPVRHAVSITSFKFVPETITAAPGDTITWTNHDIVPHTATAMDESWDTGAIARGRSKSLIVRQDDHVEYFCRFHPKMKAKLESQ